MLDDTAVSIEVWPVRRARAFEPCMHLDFAERARWRQQARLVHSFPRANKRFGVTHLFTGTSNQPAVTRQVQQHMHCHS